MRRRERTWRVDSWLPEDPGRVLDAGCSRGDSTAVYASRATEACGIDVDPEDVAAAQAAHPEIDFRVAPCEAIPFGDASFDTVVCADVLEHVYDEVRALRELRRVLAPGGTLILTVPHAGWFDWLDPVNYPRRLAPWLWRRAPSIYRALAARTDDLAAEGRPGPLREAEHRHYTVDRLIDRLRAAGWPESEAVPRRCFRSGGLVYAIWQTVAYLAAFGLRRTPRLHRAVLATGSVVGDLDYRMPWGRAAFNVAVLLRRAP